MASPLSIENTYCRIEFDGGSGHLLSLLNRPLNDQVLKRAESPGLPFRLYMDLQKEFRIDLNDKCQLVFQDPGAICKQVVGPDGCRLMKASGDQDLALTYQADALEIRLGVVLDDDSGASTWSLEIENTGSAPCSFLPSFPRFDGIGLGPDPAGNLATAMDQGGVTVPAWERPGGVLGESNQMSMQWHAVWDPASHSALSLIFMDPATRPKRIAVAEPAIELHYFPPVTLRPGETHRMPAVRIETYEGDWRPAARRYRAWFRTAYSCPPPPEWFRKCSGYMGVHFRKGNPEEAPDYGGQFVMESFRELPRVHLASAVDNLEYAFYSRASMREGGPHTDGDNTVREDLGGTAAMREGIKQIHRLGFHATLYIEGFIVFEDSELARTGKAERWSVIHRDGSNQNPYVHQGFLAMCPGCEEWQDHLAESAGRLLRETGADGIRLDSLGFYYLPCYNPAHNHADPFGYNDWLKQLLGKVRAAVLEANSEALFTCEGAADWIAPWCNGALTSRCTRDLPFMRLAVEPFRTFVYATGPLWGSLSGCPGGASIRDAGAGSHWLCAGHTAHETLVWGEVCDDPLSSDPEIVAHMFGGEKHWAVVAARPACQDPLGWPRGTSIAEIHRDYTLSFPGMASEIEDAIVCDIEDLTWRAVEIDRRGPDACLALQSNWVHVILRAPGGPRVVVFDPLPELEPGQSIRVRPSVIPEGPAVLLQTQAPGLEVTSPGGSEGQEVILTVPAGACAGHYGITFSGESVLGAKQFLTVHRPDEATRPQPLRSVMGQPDNR